MSDSELPRITVSPREAALMTGLSVPTIYQLLNSGRLASVKVGTRRLIPVRALHALLGDGSDEPRAS